MVVESSESPYKGNQCWNDICALKSYVTYGKKHYNLINWSKNETRVLQYEVLDYRENYATSTTAAWSATLTSFLLITSYSM